jgi:protein-tyrosine-phosphatase
LLAEWPDAAERVKLLCQDGGDVPDPVGGSIDVYRQSAAQIRSQLETWVDEIGLP